MKWFKQTQNTFSDWPNAVLSGALLATAAIIIVIALTPGEKLTKAIVLAYVIFP